MGYSDNYTQLMIGLGVSSISDSWYGFIQNIKTVEEYEKTVNNGVLPFFKGHMLTKEDLILRQHILNIICKYETSWESVTDQCEGVFEAIGRLPEMEHDQLVSLHPNSLKVTKKGRPFLRNICMAFYEKLWNNVPQSQIFSTVA